MLASGQGTQARHSAAMRHGKQALSLACTDNRIALLKDSCPCRKKSPCWGPVTDAPADGDYNIKTHRVSRPGRRTTSMSGQHSNSTARGIPPFAIPLFATPTRQVPSELVR